MTDQKDKDNRGLSIKRVAALNAVVAMFLLTIVVVFIGYHLFEKNVMQSYEKYAKTVLDYAYSIASDNSFGDMIGHRAMPGRYEEMRKSLNRIKENSDIEYLYAVYFEDIDDIHSLTYAINTKTEEELEKGGTYTFLGTPCEEGSFEDETIRILQKAVKNGQKESAVIDGYSEEYGHMLNGYKVLFDSAGKPVGLLCVEIDINDISMELNRYVRTIVMFAAIFTIVITIIYISTIEGFILHPITTVTKAAEDFIKNIKYFICLIILKIIFNPFFLIKIVFFNHSSW